MKIKAKLCLIFGVILVVVLVASVLYGLYSVTSTSVNNSSDMLEVRANLKTKALNQKLATIFGILQAIGGEVAVTGVNELDGDKVTESLKHLRSQLSAVESFLGVEDGNSYTHDLGYVEGFNAKELAREWYLSVFRDKKKYFIGKPYMSATTKKYVMPAGVQVVRDGKIVASLCVDMDMWDITGFITNISDNKDFYLTNEEGIIFAAKDQEEIGKSLFEIFPEFKEYNAEKSADFDFDWGKEDTQRYKMVVKSLDMLDWHFWQYEPYAEIYHESTQYLYKSIIFFVVVIIVALVIIFFVAGLISKPIVAMSDLLMKFAQTDNTEVQEDNSWSGRKDEIGMMAQAFASMLGVLKEKSVTAKEIASGNLQVEVAVLSPDDNLGLAFSQMVNDLNSILNQVNVAVNQVTEASAQITMGSSILSEGASRQASSLEEITSSMTELNNQTSANAENAGVASQIASATADAAKDGQKRMQQLTDAMNEINKNADETQKVIKTIDDIAFQTNLLALNAAVEAARAGVHGKGFAVVAEEVRNLAARSAKAAAETADLIHNSNSKIDEGVEISELTAESLSKIAENVLKTLGTIQEINAASGEQAEGISQISIGLEQIDEVTQKNTASAEETASASEEMTAQAVTLQKLVRHFKLKGIRQPNAPKPNVPQTKARRVASSNKLASSAGWGEATIVKNNAEVVNPKDQILLDDSEFGKY